MPKLTLWTKDNAPRLIALLLSLFSLLLLIALATVVRTAYKETYYVSFGSPAWTGLYMIGPCLTILHSTAILVIHVIGRGPLNSGIDLALDFFGAAANVVPAAFLALQASFTGEILGSCDVPGDVGKEWCREARTIMGLDIAALFLILIVGYVAFSFLNADSGKCADPRTGRLMHLMLCLSTCSGICNRRTSPDRTLGSLDGVAYEIEHYPNKGADDRPLAV